MLKKCPKREGGVTTNPKNFIANLRKLTHIYEELAMKNSNTGEGGSKAVWTFPKNIHIGSDSRPLCLNVQLC